MGECVRDDDVDGENDIGGEDYAGAAGAPGTPGGE